MMFDRAALTALLLTSFAGLAQADRITLADGTEIAGEDVKIQGQSLSVVTYDDGRDKDKTVPSDRVLSVEFDRLPALVDEAQAALIGGDAGGAADMLEEYVAQKAEGGDKRFPWGPAYAAWMGIELRMRFGDLGGVTEKSAAFVRTFTDSRYLPMAYLAKANAERQIGNNADVTKTLNNFREVIASRSLSKLWELEADLAEARAAGGSLESKRSTLDAIASKAGTDFPAVASRATVAIGEALLAEADKNVADQGKASSLRNEAKSLFESIVSSPSADDATLAGAYTGLGECLFYAGADTQDVEILKKAVRALLRVPVVYETESAYVPKALFLAGRSFDMMQDRARKVDMRRELESRYPNSPWTEEARKILN